MMEISHSATLAGTQSESCSLGGDGGDLDGWGINYCATLNESDVFKAIHSEAQA